MRPSLAAQCPTIDWSSVGLSTATTSRLRTCLRHHHLHPSSHHHNRQPHHQQVQDLGFFPGSEMGAQVQWDLGGGPVQALLQGGELIIMINPHRLPPSQYNHHHRRCLGGVLLSLLPPRRLRVRRNPLRGGHVQQVHRWTMRQGWVRSQVEFRSASW